MSFCRITGKSRALPKPNYFPLLPPISPADAKRFCRITGKAYGLPSHHYIPVILTTLTSNRTRCRITNISDELGTHHFMPDINYGKRKHVVLTDYRYVFPVLNETNDAQKVLLDLLNSKSVIDDHNKYVYCVNEKQCSLVFSAKLEAAVRDGDVKDVMLAKNCDSVLLKMKQGKNVSVDLKDYEDNVDELYEGEGPRYEILIEREKEELLKRKKNKKIDGLSQRAKVFEDKERLQEIELEEYEDQLYRNMKRKKLEVSKKNNKICHSVKTDLVEVRKELHLNEISFGQDLVKPVLESWDWDTYEKEAVHKDYIPVTKKLPKPLKIEPQIVETKEIEIPNDLIQNTSGFDCVPYIGQLTPIQEQPPKEILDGIKELKDEILESLLNVQEKILNNSELAESILSPEEIPTVMKSIASGKPDKKAGVPGLSLDIGAARKVFVTGENIQTPIGDVFVPGTAVSTPQGIKYVPGFTVKTPNGPSFIPGMILTPKDDPENPIFVAGQILENNFVSGQTFIQETGPKFVEGQTVMTPEGPKFVPGVISEKTNAFVIGQKLQTPNGTKFIPGQTVTIDGTNQFIAGQNVCVSENNEWKFIAGQTVENNDELQFIPGKTIVTHEGAKFVAGLYENDIFVPGITLDTNKGIEFIPGLNVETKQGPKFIEGQIVSSSQGEIFMPGKTIVNEDGNIEFAVAKTVGEVIFNEPTATAYTIDAKTSEVSAQYLSVYGFMVQTKNGIEFYPEKIDASQVPQGKKVPGKLIRQDADTKFVPGIIENGGFIPGQVVWTDKGEQFIPGQVIETCEGLKFVPGQVIVTKSGSKFVPGQTIETVDGPRFVPGQIVHTKAGPTFIPGQVIYTEEEGERFVPGQVVDTEDGPRFVPGRVVENGDKVTFIPGQIVQTSEGPKFVAPDLTDNEDGEQHFSVQSFLVTPEELTLLKPTHTWNPSSTKGELSIDSKMLRQLSEAGMTIGRQIEASAVDIVLQSTKNAQVIRQLVQKIGIEPECCELFLEFFKNIENVISSTVFKDNENKLASDVELCNGDVKINGNYKHENGFTKASSEKDQFLETVISTVVAAVNKWSQNNVNGKNKNSATLFETIVEAFEDYVQEMEPKAVEKLIQLESKDGKVMTALHETIINLYGPSDMKSTLQQIVKKQIHDEGELTTKLSSIIEDEDLNEAFYILIEQNPKILYKILNAIREKSEAIDSIDSAESAADLLKESIVKVIKEAADTELRTIFTIDRNEHTIKNLLTESLALARALSQSEVSVIINDVLQGRKSIGYIFENLDTIDVIKRILIIKKLAKSNHEMHESLDLLVKDPYEAQKDSNIRRLIRQSGTITIIPEEKKQLLNSSDIPLSFLCNHNQLAMEDFLIRRQAKKRGAFVIVKEGLQAVVPREKSRDVLTGKCAYTVLDENGIRHFEPLHVFSALKLNTPAKTHRFSIYSCDFANDDSISNNNNNHHNNNNNNNHHNKENQLPSSSVLENDDKSSKDDINSKSFTCKDFIRQESIIKPNYPHIENSALLATKRRIRALLYGDKVYYIHIYTIIYIL